MVIGCIIKFDHNSHGLYYAGQVLSGRVEITLDKPKKVKGICIKICGFAQCKWSEQETTGVGRHRRTHTVQYVGREDYLATKTYFVGSDEGNQLVLPAGLHTYNFSCSLPPVIPTSFEGTHGHIRYTARVILERPWKFDQSYKIAFTVLKPMDLNLESHIFRIPAQMETTKSFGCGPCRSGPLLLVVNLPQTGYAPGQEIRIQAQVANNSKVSIYEMKFMLRKIVKYHSQTPETKIKTETVIIQEKKTGGVTKTNSGAFDVSLLIPPVPPTNVLLCRVIHITYDIKVEARVSTMHSNAKVKIPITIGTVPLNQYGGGATNPPFGWVRSIGDGVTNSGSYTVQPSAPQETPSIAAAAGTSATFIDDNNTIIDSPYPDIPPPSYEESMFGNRHIADDDDQHTIGIQPYTPRYPVYHFNNVSIGNQQPVTADSATVNESNTNVPSTTENLTLHSEKLREKIASWN